ncbi:hypothetical protein BJ138DRAFT_968464, partial [Hygrophoropsis aurantiaca]
IPHPDNPVGPRLGQKVKGYHLVTQGQEVGISFNWSDAAECVHGVSGAKYQKYQHWDEAVEAYHTKSEAGLVRVKPIKGSTF